MMCAMNLSPLLDDVENLCNHLGQISEKHEDNRDKQAIALAAMAIWFIRFRSSIEEFRSYLLDIENGPAKPHA
jgi:hypothetical protein